MVVFDNIANRLALVSLVVFMGISVNSYGAADTTLFRIKSLQDTVDAGDTVDVDVFIGDEDHLSDGIKEFELEIEYDLDICDKNKIEFTLDNPSLSAFFGTSFTDISTVNTTTGHVNVQVSCSSIGSGTARIGRIRYIVQDNVNGRQLLRFDFFKLSAKRQNGGGNDKPVRMQGDSVLVIRGYNQVPTSVRNNSKTDMIKIFPNPVTDYVQLEGEEIKTYRLLGMDGSIITSIDNENHSAKILLPVRELNNGIYLLQLNINGQWKSYQILKE